MNRLLYKSYSSLFLIAWEMSIKVHCEAPLLVSDMWNDWFYEIIFSTSGRSDDRFPEWRRIPRT